MDFPVCSIGWKIAIDIISDLSFLVDIVIQMHCAYFVDNPNVREPART